MGALRKKQRALLLLRPCCVTAIAWSREAGWRPVSRKQSAAVGHLLKRELFGSFLGFEVVVPQQQIGIVGAVRQRGGA